MQPSFPNSPSVPAKNDRRARFRWVWHAMFVGCMAVLMLAVSAEAQNRNAQLTEKIANYALAAANNRQPASCSLNPSAISAQRQSNVFASVSLNVSEAPSNLRLYMVRVLPDGSIQSLGDLSTSDRRSYSTTLSFNEPNPTVIPLQVYASSGAGAATANIAGARTTSRPVSPTCNLTVVTASSQNGGSASNNNNGKGSGWQGVVGGLIGGLLSGGNKQNNQQNSEQNIPPNNQGYNQPTNQGNNNPGNDGYPPQRNEGEGGQSSGNSLRPLTARGISFQYPPNWNFHTEVLNLGGPIALRNFDSYLGGGVMPWGGAEIDITTVPSQGVSLSSLALAELGGAPSQDFRVDDHPALRTIYTDAYGPGLSYENQAVYVMNGDKVYKFFLSYRSGDSRQGSFQQAFNTILSSTRFVAR